MGSNKIEKKNKRHFSEHLRVRLIKYSGVLEAVHYDYSRGFTSYPRVDVPTVTGETISLSDWAEREYTSKHKKEFERRMNTIKALKDEISHILLWSESAKDCQDINEILNKANQKIPIEKAGSTKNQQ